MTRSELALALRIALLSLLAPDRRCSNCKHDDAPRILAWLRDHRIATLNVAGPRESKSPGIQAATRAALNAILADELGFGGR